MAVVTGRRYVADSGAEVIVTSGHDGTLSDGDQPLLPKQEGCTPRPSPADGKPLLHLGKRYQSRDGTVEVLVIRPGICDLRHDGEPRRLMERGDGAAGAGVPAGPLPPPRFDGAEAELRGYTV